MVPSISDFDRSSKSDARTRPLDPTLSFFIHFVTTVVAADAVAGASFLIFPLGFSLDVSARELERCEEKELE